MCNNHKNIITRVLSVPSAKAPFERTTIERRELRPDDEGDIHNGGVEIRTYL